MGLAESTRKTKSWLSDGIWLGLTWHFTALSLEPTMAQRRNDVLCSPSYKPKMVLRRTYFKHFNGSVSRSVVCQRVQLVAVTLGQAYAIVALL